jgi:hypothetical protein
MAASGSGRHCGMIIRDGTVALGATRSIDQLLGCGRIPKLANHLATLIL